MFFPGCGAAACPRLNATSMACPTSGSYVQCSSGAVVELRLTRLALTGTISSHIALLSRLTVLSLNSNQLHSTVPSVIASMTALRDLNLGSNRLVGSLPPAMAQMTQLRLLNVQENFDLNGTLPLTTAFTDLQALNAFDTRISGRIPVMPSFFCNVSRSLINCADAPGCDCSARVLNDDCIGRMSVDGGSTAVSAAGATTCEYCGNCTVHSDVWFSWRASCAGRAIVSNCDAININPFTEMAVYRDGCPGPTTASIDGSCNDYGTCIGPNELVEFDVVPGEEIIVRFGSSNRSRAEATLRISCEAAPTPPPSPTTAAPPTPSPTIATTISTTTTTEIAAIPTTTQSPSGVDVPLIAGIAGGAGGACFLASVIVVLVCRSKSKGGAAGTEISTVKPTSTPIYSAPPTALMRDQQQPSSNSPRYDAPPRQAAATDPYGAPPYQQQSPLPHDGNYDQFVTHDSF